MFFLGDAYRYLIGQLLVVQIEMQGEFYTPQEVKYCISQTSNNG
jgi:type I restriction-modification system DNA methylase subunit